MANQPSHAEGAVDRSPGRLLEIELYKDVARKQRRLHHIAPARVAAFAPVARQIGSEALALKVEAGALFALGLGLGNIPARHRRASHCAAAMPAGRNLDSRSKLGKRSEEHTSELQSLMRISYAVFGLKKKNT